MMRRLLITLTIIVAATAAHAQWTYPIGTPTWYKKVRVDSVFWLNTVDTVHSYATLYPGALMARTTGGDTSLYMANGTRWVRIGSASTDILSGYWDSTTTKNYVFTNTRNPDYSRITQDLPPSYYGWGVANVQDGIITNAYRRGLTHDPDSQGKMIFFQSADKGVTWSTIDSISVAGWDVRNYGGGITRTGRQIFFYTLINSEFDFGGLYWVASTNNWATKTFSAARLDSNGMDRYNAYGPMVELPSGKLLQTFYGRMESSNVSKVWTLESTDGGITWGNPVTILTGDTLDASNYYTECSISYIRGETDGSSILAGVCRRNENTPVQVRSIDGGVTWTNDGVVGGSLYRDVSPWTTRIDDNQYLYAYADRVNLNISYYIVNYDAIAISSNNYTGKRIIYKSEIAYKPNAWIAEFGYPVIIQPGLNLRDMFVLFYDMSPKQPTIDGINKNYSEDIIMAPLVPLPTLEAWRTTSQSIPSGVNTGIVFTGVNIDTHHMLDNDTITIPEDGVYIISAQVRFAESSSGTYRRAYLQAYDKYTNTTRLLTTDKQIPSAITEINTLQLNNVLYLRAGEIINVAVNQDTGSALNTSPNPPRCYINIKKVL